MALANKIDSNQTELRVAVEESIGVLPATPEWIQVDPNEYDDFGGEVTTVARNPINKSRQRKKGVVVDVDAAGGFTVDLTQENFQTPKFMEGFLFAATRTHVELSVADVDGTGNDYQPASGGGAYFANDLLFAKLFENTANNGVKLVTGTPAAASVTVTDTGLVDENGASGIISRVGHQFAVGTASIDVSNPLPRLVVSGIAQASRVLTFTDQPADTETVTIGSTVYTFQTTLTNVAGNVKIGATLADSIINLKNAINRNGLGTPGTDFATATVAHPLVTVTAFNGTTMTATAIVAGTSGNSIATTETVVNASWASATLTGGTGVSLLDYDLFEGMWVCVGDDGTDQSFVETENNGLKRVRNIANTYLEFDKSTLPMVVDAGTGKTVRVIWGRVVKNENGQDDDHPIVRTSFQLERSLGAPDEAQPTQIQGEYLTGSIPNEFELTVEQANKVTASLSFMSRSHEVKTAAEGLKSGTRPVLADADAFNSTSHVARVSLAVIEEGNEAPTDLFAFIMDMTLTINNNVSANKAIKFLGAFDNTAGTFEVSAELNAYFQSVEAISTVRDNADGTLDITFAQGNQGITLDLPLVSFGNGLADVQQDEAIMIPIETAAATGAAIDTALDYTLLVQFWDYLPSLAA
jgi:hypothetical protein